MQAIDFAQQNADRFVEELKTLLRIPSISTDPDHIADVRAAAELCRTELERIGMHNARLIETTTEEQVSTGPDGVSRLIPPRLGHPLVLADWLDAGPNRPTVLLYAHYDVQPAEPLNEWLSPPFEPTERNGDLYARGAVDDKGQLWMQFKTLESLFAAGAGTLPVNVRVILEGEEEVGGEGIAAFVHDHPDQLRADVALISDTELFAPDLPTLCVGLRGLLYTEIEVRGARTDLHSGMFGGAAPNPFFALAHILSHLKDQHGRILIPGIYDHVKKPTDAELAAWSTLPFDEAAYLETEIGSPALVGEPGFSVLERLWARPTLEVHGMPGGFTGVGAKTVIPARAVAKVSLRLVPDMTSAEAFQALQSFITQITPPGVTAEVRLIHAGDPVVISTDNPFIQAATVALEQVWSKPAVFVRSGGSIPVVGEFVRELGIPAILMGFGLPDDNLHAPNEKFHLSNFHRGIASLIGFFEQLGSPKQS